MWIVEMISRTELEHAILAGGHSIWIGGALGLLLWVCLRLVPARYAALRYVMTLGALGLLVVSLPATYTVLLRAGTPAAVTTGSQALSSAVPSNVEPAIPAVLLRQDVAEGHIDWVQIAALLWAAGFAAMLIRMAVQLRGTRRLLDGAQDASQTAAGQTMGRLLQRLQWRAPLRVLLTPQLNSPAVLGIFRPVLLIPPAIACELTPQQLESILLHELAHIRRYDYLVNIGQLLVEALLFFNPAVWLISRQVRIEREACCDAFAARITGEPLRYAEALGVVMGRLGSMPATMAATGQGRGTALDRVRRLLVPGYRPGLRLSGPVLTGAVVAGLLLLACLWQATGTVAAAVAAESSTTRASGEDAGKADLGIIAADNPGEGEYYVGGQVARVGVYSLSAQQQITLKQAVVSAGIDNKTILPGVTVDLIRRLPGNKERITTIDLDAVFKGTQPDRYLQPNDILQVRTSPSATAPAQPTTSSTIQRVGSGKIPPDIIAADNPGDVGEYYMGGQVKRGGVYSLTAREITLKQAVVSAGGVDSKTPAGMQALLIRRLPGNKESFSTVDVAAVFQNTQPDYYLQPYDLLIVQSASHAPASAQPAALPGVQVVGSGKITLDIIPANNPGDGEYYMGGHVQRVGVYSLTRRQITIKQALVSAGGLDAKIPAAGQTLLIRRPPGGQERITPIDLDALFKGTQPDRYLQPNDILVVGTKPPATAPATPK